MRKRLFAVLVTFLGQFVLAQKESVFSKPIEIEEVIVTATRSLKKLKDVPITIQVITSQDIEKAQATDFQRFMETEYAGISFANHGGSPNVNMMGFGGKYVLFLLNGERMAGETFDNIDYDRIDVDNIERIEIIKGASSSLYGSNAVGGVVNIITKKPTKNIEINAGYLYDTSKDQKINLSVGTKQKWGEISLSSFYKKREPYILKDSEPRLLIYKTGEVVQGELGEMNVAGFTNYGISPRLNFHLSPKMNLEITPSYYFSQRNDGTEASKKVLDNYYNYSIGAKSDYRFSETGSVSFSAFYDRYDKFNFYRLLNEEEKNYENSVGRASVQYNQTLVKKHTLVAGFEALNDELMNLRFNSEGTQEKRNTQTYTFFTQQDWLLTPNFTLVTSVRMDYHRLFKEFFTFRLSGMYRLPENITLRGGYASGFRSPTLKELYTNWYHPWGGGFQVLGSQLLTPETSDNFNFSVDYSNGKWNLTAMTQYSIFDNKIHSVWSSEKRDELRFENAIGKSAIFGSEFSASYRLNANFKFTGGYSFYDVENTVNEMRPHIFTFKTDFTPKPNAEYIPTITFSGKYFSQNSIYDESTKGEYVVDYEAYSLWRLYLSMKLPYGFSLSGGVNNLFDYTSKIASFYTDSTQGRTYFAGAKWRF